MTKSKFTRLPIVDARNKLGDPKRGRLCTARFLLPLSWLRVASSNFMPRSDTVNIEVGSNYENMILRNELTRFGY